MCQRLYLASPLTLSEIRSMLPEGVTANLADPPARRAMLDLMPSAREVVTLQAGSCACDLSGRRAAAGMDDGRDLRARYRAAGTPRSEVIRLLDLHRTPPTRRNTADRAAAFAAFVAEHARNAGASLFWLRFVASATQPPAWPARETVSVRPSGVLAGPGWLKEEVPTVVVADLRGPGEGA